MGGGLGMKGEEIAAEYLRRRGMRILARNWRCPTGELDIIAAWGETLVAVEVKTRTMGRYAYPFHRVTPEKVARLRRLVRRWRTQSGMRFRSVRIDAVSVLHTMDGRWHIRHHRRVTG
ncbi:YraN family protein [Spiractinospora alimapuensis]|uniref:YraN family protein n=1 Tax=Spiractinospora alimapuensis TaxID=2820884 RepID=UPI002ED3E4C9